MSAAASNVFQCRGAAAVEDDARRQCMRQYLEIRPPHGGLEVGIGGAAAAAARHRHVHAAEAFLLKPVHIGGVRIARLAGGGEPGGMQGVLDGAVASLQLAAVAAILVAALLAR